MGVGDCQSLDSIFDSLLFPLEKDHVLLIRPLLTYTPFLSNRRIRDRNLSSHLFLPQ